MIQTEALQIIQAVAHFGSFTTAAKHLHKVPSAISYSVRKVEETLGVQLFLRGHRQVTLTPAGEHFVAEARGILNQIQELAQATSQIATGVEPELHIVIDNVVNQGAIEPMLKVFQKQFPDTRLHITPEVYIGCWDSLLHSRCQLAIGAPITIPDEVRGDHSFSWKEMGPLTWHMVMAPNHPLAQLRAPGTTVTPADLENYTTITVKDSSRVLNHGGDTLSLYGHSLVVASFRQALNCAIEGIGVCMVPTHFSKHLLDDHRLVAREVSHFSYNSHCLLAWNTKNMGAGLKWCLEWLGDTNRLTRDWLCCRTGLGWLDIS